MNNDDHSNQMLCTSKTLDDGGKFFQKHGKKFPHLAVLRVSSCRPDTDTDTHYPLFLNKFLNRSDWLLRGKNKGKRIKVGVSRLEQILFMIVSSIFWVKVFYGENFWVKMDCLNEK